MQSLPAVCSLWEWAAYEVGTKSLLSLSSFFVPSCSISVQVSFEVFLFVCNFVGNFKCVRKDSSIRNPRVPHLASVMPSSLVSYLYPFIVPQQTLSPGVYTSMYLATVLG